MEKNLCKKNNKVVMSNTLMASDWSKLSLVELRALSAIIGKINPEWDDFKEITFEMNEFKKKINFEKKNMTVRELYSVVKKVNIEIEIAGIIWLKDEEGNDCYRYTAAKNAPLFKSVGVESVEDWVNNVSEKRVVFEINDVIKSHTLVSNKTKRDENGQLLRDSNGKVIGQIEYSSFPENILDELGTAYSIRLFFKLLSMANKKPEIISFDKLMAIMGIPNNSVKDKNKLLKKYYNFKNRRLKPALDKINELSDIVVDFRDDISGDDIFIEFKVTKKRRNSISDRMDNAIIIDNESNLDIETKLDEVFDIIESVPNNKQLNDADESDSEDLNKVLECYKKHTEKKVSKKVKSEALKLINTYSTDSICSIIEEFNVKISGLAYVEKILQSRLNLNNEKNQKKSNKNNREISFKDANVSGEDMKKAIESQLGEEIFDFDKLFKKPNDK